MKAIVIDDSKSIRKLVGGVFGFLGYESLEASGTEAGLALVDCHDDIELLVVDLNMPGPNGFACLRQLAGGEGGPKYKMMLSSQADEQSRAEAESLGAVFFQKPFAVDELAEQLRRLTSSG